MIGAANLPHLKQIYIFIINYNLLVLAIRLLTNLNYFGEHNRVEFLLGNLCFFSGNVFLLHENERAANILHIDGQFLNPPLLTITFLYLISYR